MIAQQLLLVLILTAMVLLYVTRWLPSEATSLLVIFALIITGILPATEAFSGFSSTATITVAAMFVLSTGLLRTGALDTIAVLLVRWAGRSIQRMILVMGLFIPVSSAFINNTPVVIMMVPVLLSVSRKLNFQPSKLMIPLSYLSILGGTATLIGTSTNILVDDLYRTYGGPGFGLFEFMPLGVIFTVAGTLYLFLFGHRSLPTRAPLTSLVSNRRQTPYVTELTVGQQSKLIGQPARAAFPHISPILESTRFTSSSPRRSPQGRRLSLRNQPQRDLEAEESESSANLELLAIYRDGIAYLAAETQEIVFQENDLILLAGSPEQIDQFIKRNQTGLATVLADDERVPMADLRQKVVEAVILPDSPTIGRMVKDLKLNRDYNIKVMGLQRNGQQVSRGLRNTRLGSGNVLLLQGTPEALQRAGSAERLLLIEGIDSTIPRLHKSRLSLSIMVAVIVLAAATQWSIGALAIAGAALMIVTRCLQVEEAVSALSADTLLLLAATIPMGIAIQTTGMAQTIVDGLYLFGESVHPVLFLSLFYLLTNLLTQLLSNNAVAVLFTPISLTLAAQLGVDPKPLLMAIAFGASASFMTPMGYQTNAIVMGPGGYIFSDFLQIGIPLSIIMWILATLCIPFIWPL